MTGRGQANLLTRTTAILAGAFFLTSMLLSILAGYTGQPTSVLDRVQPAGGRARQAGRLRARRRAAARSSTSSVVPRPPAAAPLRRRRRRAAAAGSAVAMTGRAARGRPIP